jgi:hypothetical protein
MRFSLLGDSTVRLDADTSEDETFLLSLGFTEGTRVGQLGSGANGVFNPSHLIIGRLQTMPISPATTEIAPMKQSADDVRRTLYRQVLAVAFGTKWEEVMTPTFIAGCGAYSHAMTVTIMSLYVPIDGWPAGFPAHNLDVIWDAWRRTFTVCDRVGWQW